MQFNTWLEKNSGNGKAFEELTKRFLLAEPNIAHVWMWEEYPDRDGADMGIDLVVENRDGQRWAVQCKNYTNTITWGDIATFAGASTEFERKILVTSRPGVTNNAHKQMQRLGIEHYGPEVFENFNCHAQAKNKRKKVTLRPYQRAAIKAVEGQQRGILHMPTGSGKTVVLSRIASGKRTLVVVPSISLASQTARAFLADDPNRRAIVVCSDRTTGREDENWAGVPVCQTTKEISQYPEHGVFVTMNSLSKVVEAAGHFDLVLVDEAHRLAKFGQMGSEVFDYDCPVLFATATPKMLHEDLRDHELAKNIPTMDDVQKFGKVLYSISVRELIDQGYLSDYVVHILAVRDTEIAQMVAERSYLEYGNDTLSAEDAAFYAGLERAMDDHDLKRVITYHSRVSQAEEAARFLRARGKHARAISAKTPDYERRNILDGLKHGGIVTNARTLQEGIDVPSLDAVCFASPKYSKVDIVQSVGRALRKDPNNPEKVGHIILPVVVDTNESAELQLEVSRFSHIYTVLTHLAEQDSLLTAEIEQIKTGKGALARGTDPNGCRILVTDIQAVGNYDQFVNQIRLHAVRPAGPTAQERVEAFVKEHGRLPNCKRSGREENNLWQVFRSAIKREEEWALNLHGRYRQELPTRQQRVEQWFEVEGKPPRAKNAPRTEVNVYRAWDYSVKKGEKWALQLRKRHRNPKLTMDDVEKFSHQNNRTPVRSRTLAERKLYFVFEEARKRGDERALRLREKYPTRFSRTSEEAVREWIIEYKRLPKPLNTPKNTGPEEASVYARLGKGRRQGRQWAIDLYEEYKDKG